MPKPSNPAVFVVIPVFNRVDTTLRCLDDLWSQTFPDLRIVVVDGGSTDDTVARLSPMSDVHLISDVGEQWWTGATWFGIEHALQHGGDDDYVMLLNNDTRFGPEMVEVLVAESIRFDAPVAPIARVEDGSIVNGGTWFDWKTYEITQGVQEPEASSTWSVDALEGRGSLVPIRAIRAAGNVDRERLPHYGADLEFSLRLARHGWPPMMTNRTSVTVDWDVADMRRYQEPASVRRIWWELTNRGSFVSIPVHFALIDLAAPPHGRWKLKARLLGRWIEKIARRSRLRHLRGSTVMVPGPNQLLDRARRIVARQWWRLRN